MIQHAKKNALHDVTPSISVIIPAHNLGRWIGESLDSVVQQSHVPAEIIVVDDGSSDNTIDVVNAHATDCLVIDSPHRNAAATRNLGASVARGDWIAFLDGDDIWMAHHLEQTILSHQAGCDACFCSFRTFQERFLDLPAKTARLSTGVYDCGVAVTQFIDPDFGWPTSGMSIKRELFNERGGFNVSLKRRHDAEMFVRSIRGHQWFYQSDPTWHYRQGREGNISNNHKECSYFFLKALDSIASVYGMDAVRSRYPSQVASALRHHYAEGDLVRFREILACYKHFLTWPTRLAFGVVDVVPAGIVRRMRSLTRRSSKSPSLGRSHETL